MIADAVEYERAQEELKEMEEWLIELRTEPSDKARRYTVAGVRKMIARLHEELAVYECDHGFPTSAT